MRKLNDCEMYQKAYATNVDMRNAISQQLSQNIGVIDPSKIDVPLLSLKNRSKSADCPLLSEAISLYESRGLIRLFNLSSVNAGKSKIPTVFPYFPAKARNRIKETDTINNNNGGMDNVIFVNMYRIGNWSADESTYDNLSPMTDLYTCLESGVIGYKLTIDHMADKVFDDRVVIEYLSKIYTFMMSQAIIRAKTMFGGTDFLNDTGNFLIAKFFIRYVLEKPESDATDDYAYLSVLHGTSIDAIKSFEDINMINYESLSGFLDTFGKAFYSGEGIDLASFEIKWLALWGDSLGLAVEYAPYLLHFLFACQHGAILGGMTRINRQRNTLNKLGLPKLYNAVILDIK